MATQFKVISPKGEEVFVVKPKHILRSEREFKDLDPVESTYRLAWMASGTLDDFDTWMDYIDDITPILPDDVDTSEEEVPPTTAGSRRSRSTRA